MRDDTRTPQLPVTQVSVGITEAQCWLPCQQISITYFIMLMGHNKCTSLYNSKLQGEQVNINI
jgi:hypothetical protein